MTVTYDLKIFIVQDTTTILIMTLLTKTKLPLQLFNLQVFLFTFLLLSVKLVKSKTTFIYDISRVCISIVVVPIPSNGSTN